jgi:hypothetical protein
MSCGEKQPESPQPTYTQEQICEMEMQEKISFARRISPIIDRLLLEKKKDSVKIYLDSLHWKCGADGSKEWMDFMAEWNYLKYGVKPQKSSLK